MSGIPKSIRVTTGGQQSAYDVMDEFFISIHEQLKEKYGDSPYFEIKRNHLAIPYNRQITDETLHMLLYEQRVVAAVIETRTDFNNVQFDFFKNLEGLLDDEK